MFLLAGFAGFACVQIAANSNIPSNARPTSCRTLSLSINFRRSTFSVFLTTLSLPPFCTGSLVKIDSMHQGLSAYWLVYESSSINSDGAALDRN